MFTRSDSTLSFESNRHSFGIANRSVLGIRPGEFNFHVCVTSSHSSPTAIVDSALAWITIWLSNAVPFQCAHASELLTLYFKTDRQFVVGGRPDNTPLFGFGKSDPLQDTMEVVLLSDWLNIDVDDWMVSSPATQTEDRFWDSGSIHESIGKATRICS